MKNVFFSIAVKHTHAQAHTDTNTCCDEIFTLPSIYASYTKIIYFYVVARATQNLTLA